MYISVGDRVRPPSKGYYVPAALAEEGLGVIVFGVSIIPGGMYVPGFRYLYMFCRRGMLGHHRV